MADRDIPNDGTDRDLHRLDNTDREPEAEVIGLALDPDLEAALDDRTEIVTSSAVARFRTTTLTGAVLNGFALGLREVLEGPKREEAPIMAEANGEPDEDRMVDAYLDPDDPTASVVTIRPWLFDAAPDQNPTVLDDREDTP